MATVPLWTVTRWQHYIRNKFSIPKNNLSTYGCHLLEWMLNTLALPLQRSLTTLYHPVLPCKMNINFHILFQRPDKSRLEFCSLELQLTKQISIWAPSIKEIINLNQPFSDFECSYSSLYIKPHFIHWQTSFTWWLLYSKMHLGNSEQNIKAHITCLTSANMQIYPMMNIQIC